MSTILIADDEARIRRLVSDFLKRDGHTIVEAADGKEALNILENRRPGLDMAILDVMMPGMDGFEVLRELREQEHGETSNATNTTNLFIFILFYSDSFLNGAKVLVRFKYTIELIQ